MSQEITVIDVDGGTSAMSRIERLANPSTAIFSTFTDNSFEGRIGIVNALTNSVPLNEHLGTIINLQNFITQVVEVNTEDRGNIEAVRTVLVDDEGNSYHAISDGIVSALETLVGMLGMPGEWPHAVPVVATENKSRNGRRYMTLTAQA